MKTSNDNKPFRFLLYFLHFFLGINAFIGGLLLMLRPDGSLLQMNISFLNGTPFHNFFIPGLLLLTFIGILSIITFFGLLFKIKGGVLNAMNIYRDRFWAWTYSLYAGIAAIIWITVQLVLTQFFWIQPVIIFIGVGIIICSLIPGVMKYYENKMD